MGNKIKLLVFNILTFGLMGQNIYQDQSFEILDTNSTGSIYFYGSASLDGALPMKFGQHFTKGDFITTSEIDGVLKQLGGSPNMHHHAKSGVYYHLNLDSLLKEGARFERMQLNVGLSYNNLSYAAFSPDAFELIFKGNHLDSLYILQPLDFEYISYFKLSAGFSFKVENSTLGFALSYFQADQFFGLNSDALELVSPANQTALHTRGVAHYDRLIKENNAPFVPYGFGAGIDLFFEQKINDRQRLSFMVEDLSFLHFRNTESVWIKDSIFKGVPVQGFNANIENLEDSVQEWFSAPQKSNKLYWLPTRLNLHYQHKFQKIPFQLHAYLSYRAYPGFIPLAIVRMEYLGNIAQPYIQVGAGGWNNFQYGLGLALKWKKHQIALHLQNLEGITLPKNYLGTSVGLTYRTIWNNDKKFKTSK